MSTEIGMVLATAAPMAVFAYAAINLGNSDDDGTMTGILRLFYWGVAQLFGVATLWTGSRVAAASSNQGLATHSSALNGFTLVAIFVFMAYVFVWIVMYVKQSVLAAGGQEEFDPEV